jgi:hypothetical protein
MPVYVNCRFDNDMMKNNVEFTFPIDWAISTTMHFSLSSVICHIGDTGSVHEHKLLISV